MTDFTLTTDADGVAIITWDCPEKSMNVMSFEGLRELEACIDQVLADDAIRGAVITSGKDSFAGGMDLNILASLRDEGSFSPLRNRPDRIPSAIICWIRA